MAQIPAVSSVGKHAATPQQLGIAHIGTIGGVSVSLAEEQRRRGHSAVAFCFDDMLHRQYGGIMINYSQVTAFRGEWKIHPFWWLDRRRMYRILEKSDLWHYHYPYGTLKADLFSRAKGRSILKHYHGDDLRSKFDGDYCLVSTPDLLEFAPNGEWVPNPVDVDRISAFRKPFEPRDVPKIAHYPHYKNYGADLYVDHYSKALYELQDEGKCEVVEVLRMPYLEALQAVSECDIIMGKILPSIGWFGRFELEGMALGRPVVAYVSDMLYEKYRPPVCRTTKETLKEDLAALIADHEEQRRLSAAGLKYVTEKHDTPAVCRLLDRCYARL